MLNMTHKQINSTADLIYKVTVLFTLLLIGYTPCPFLILMQILYVHVWYVERLTPEEHVHLLC